MFLDLDMNFQCHSFKRWSLKRCVYKTSPPTDKQPPLLQQGKTLRKRGQARVYHIHIFFISTIYKHSLTHNLTNKSNTCWIKNTRYCKHKYIFPNMHLSKKSHEKHCNIWLFFVILLWENVTLLFLILLGVWYGCIWKKNIVHKQWC